MAWSLTIWNWMPVVAPIVAWIWAIVLRMSSDSMGDFRPPPRQTKYEQFVDKLKLNKEQKDEAMSALSAALEESAPVRADMDKSRVAITSALLDGKSGDEVKKLMDEYAAATAKMTAVEVKAFSRVFASLKPNQQAKAGPSFELLAEVLDQAIAGAGARGGRGRERS